ncbi:signal protein [Achromobacter piechaudii]|uniref:histidine kinase n=2 Tax=Achromobacter piechaudii TaxID=72556 RepID=A0ABM8KQN9_9BURK|nr:extracellular solute-binding protein [Achromobacter piechaudii]KNY04953.1 signal protein [Achromobacter piechaudii]CAB3652586.1 Adaptive-response sensory-kinase SasA [Achromobacter piechaudii]CAB3815273.1 Adaptive-response sensory-kinase SasA [Achromobacter piechaudii]CAB3946184.1 Adaptive-response sensory-kinase SasA [Achromobacter piechaudii]
MSIPESASIRRRVFTLGVVLLACALIGLVFFLRDYAQRAAEQAFDRLLAASALTIAGSVQIDDEGVTVEPPVSSLAMLSGGERVFYEARTSNGRLITGYGDLAPNLPLAQAATPVFAYVTYHDEPVRVATVGRLVSASQHAGWVTVRVAETLGSREELAQEILGRGVLPLLVVSLVALGLLWFGVQRAFAPLAVLERELRTRAPEDLTPVTTPVPREVRSLVEALNAFMQRLSIIMDTLNTLVADATHQVRTPLASLRAQAEVALDETDPQRLRERIGRIHLNATHASQLINQLLMDATITHRLGKGPPESVGVAETINETRRRIGPVEAERLRIEIAPEVRRARLAGDRVALREMLRNLVDNALRYAPEGTVDIQATPVAGFRVALTVSDRGPGISDDEKEAVQQRFTRGRAGESQPGSGLGLAIVRSVAVAHGGSLWLHDRPGGGLTARVILPLQQQPIGRNLAAWLGAACTAMLLFASVPQDARAAPLEEIVTRYPAPQPTSRTLVIAGPTDTPVVAPLIQGFQSLRPDVSVVYREISSRDLYEATIDGRLTQVDVLMSSASDLQIRLANDGYAQAYSSPYAAKLPSWAVWRNEVYGFTFEPALIVYNPKRFTEATVPRSRQDILRLLERERASLQGRVGTYDIAASSLGYLLAEQDELVSSNFWGLANAMGQVGVRLSPTSAQILDAIENDELDLAYNILGSYALSRQAAGSKIGVVFPQDYVLVLARSVLISRRAPSPDLARALVDWLLSPAGQQVASSHAALGSIMEDTPGRWTSEAVLARSQGIVQPVVLSPALLVGLDQRRHSRFVQNWVRLVTDTPTSR